MGVRVAEANLPASFSTASTSAGLTSEKAGQASISSKPHTSRIKASMLEVGAE